ncbi:MAG: calcium-binding protein [Hyphomicrobiales bacterium]|nr:calcium-binding protein [Hyphomicrobiales bacterium]
MSTITGTRFADILTGTDLSDVIRARSGDDIIDGGDGNDKIRAGKGNDTIDGGDGDDKIRAGRGDDRIEMSAGTDTILGGAGADTLVVSGNGGVAQWTDFMLGVDKIEINLSLELFDHLVSFEASGEDLASTTISFGESRIELSGVDVSMVSSADFVFVEPEFNVIEGTQGADRIVATAEDDKVFGGAGNDTLFGQEGDDFLLGEDGNDWLYGSYGNDTLIGGAGADRMFGAVGDDLLIGGDGDDSIQPGPGDNDIVYGGAGSDIVDLHTYSNVEFSTNTTWMDFEDGIDLIEMQYISGLTAENFDQTISITDDGNGNTQISYDTIELTLSEISASDITIDDFIL